MSIPPPPPPFDPVERAAYFKRRDEEKIEMRKQAEYWHKHPIKAAWYFRPHGRDLDDLLFRLFVGGMALFMGLGLFGLGVVAIATGTIVGLVAIPLFFIGLLMILMGGKTILYG
jgi:hypothetical protein